MRLELETGLRGVIYAKVTHFTYSVNRLAINTVMNITRAHYITQCNAGALFADIGNSCSLDQSSILSRLLCRFTKS